MKQLLSTYERQHKGLRHRIFGAIQRGHVDGFHLPGENIPEEEDI